MSNIMNIKPYHVYNLTITQEDVKIPALTLEQSWHNIVKNGRTFGYVIEDFICNKHDNLESTHSLGAAPDAIYDNKYTVQIKTTSDKHYCYVSKSGLWDKSKSYEEQNLITRKYFSKYDFFIIAYKKLFDTKIEITYSLVDSFTISTLQNHPKTPTKKNIDLLWI